MLCNVASVHALPILLTLFTQNGVTGGARGGNVDPLPLVTQVDLDLAIGPSSSSSSNGCPGTTALLGCQPNFTPGQTGVFDFNDQSPRSLTSGGPHQAAVFVSCGARTHLKRRLIACRGGDESLISALVGDAELSLAIATTRNEFAKTRERD